MSKIPVASLIADFRRMLAEHWAYGAETKTGQVDCSGAFVWSYQQHGHNLYHGSNRMARVEAEELIPIGEAIVVPGMAAFKRREPGASGYALPSSYKQGGAHYNGDLGDYYHVGLVDEDTSRVLNAQSTSTGFVASSISQNWTHVAFLKQVDYVGEATDPVDATSSATAVIVAASGKTVNLRKTASKSASLVERVPIGQTVTLRGPECDGWYPVRWGKREGWVMAEFLDVGQNSEAVPDTEPSISSWAVTFFGLTREQAVGLQSEIGEYRSKVEECNG